MQAEILSVLRARNSKICLDLVSFLSLREITQSDGLQINDHEHYLSATSARENSMQNIEIKEEN